MRSTRLEPPFHRVNVTKRALEIVRKSVVDLMHYSCTILLGPIPSEPLSCQLPEGGPREAAIGTSRPFAYSM